MMTQPVHKGPPHVLLNRQVKRALASERRAMTIRIYDGTNRARRIRPGRRLVPDPSGGPAQHHVLMPEHQQLSILRLISAEHQHEQLE
jgi:hypothetical protein